MDFDINRPWLTLDDWQKKYIFDPEPNKDNFLLTTRQAGKTTAMSLRAVELCVNHFKKGEFVLLNSITEKQAYHLLTKAMIYAKEKYFKHVIWKGKDKPTMHKLLFNNGTGILCYAAGERGEGLRGYTIKKLMVDEGSRMSEEYFIAIMPALSVIQGSMDIASTPYGKRHPDGQEKFFYKCSKDPNFTKYYISAEDCPRHTEEFLKTQRERMTKLAYAQEYEAVFTDELRRVFDDDIIKRVCVLNRRQVNKSDNYLGVDVAGFGQDECTFQVVRTENDQIKQIESIIEKRNYTTDTSNRILQLNTIYDFEKIGIDDGGIGFGVFSELMNNDDTKRKTIALNNASRPIDKEGKKSKKILKEEMYLNALRLMETRQLFLLDDDEIKASLSSIQHDEGKIFGSYSHITEGIIRAVWLAEKYKDLNLRVYSIKV